MILDFGEVKRILCEWLENHWDHRFLIWEEDPWAKKLLEIDSKVYLVPFNPTAENIAEYFLTSVGPKLLEGTNCELIECNLWETDKCLATASFE
jgi:6-pyruvoyltetrahydropterin/6-carboxytetrahydropterin synthase